MSQEILLHHLLGRPMFDADGVKIGRIEELEAEIELHAADNDYVVTVFYVGSFGRLVGIADSHFMRLLIRRLGRFATYTLHRIPWELVDVSDPLRPRLRCRVGDLPAGAAE